MNVLTVYAHPDPKSFCHAVLQQFTKGLEDAGHTNETIDLLPLERKDKIKYATPYRINQRVLLAFEPEIAEFLQALKSEI